MQTFIFHIHRLTLSRKQALQQYYIQNMHSAHHISKQITSYKRLKTVLFRAIPSEVIQFATVNNAVCNVNQLGKIVFIVKSNHCFKWQIVTLHSK